MVKILKGGVVAKGIKEEIKKDVEELKVKNINPSLAIVRLGENPDDISYEKSIIKNCDKLGIEAKVVTEKEDASTDELVSLIEELNANKDIHGILVFRPLPKQINEDVIRNTIDPNKDIDCMHPLNLERVCDGKLDKFVPCTPKSALEILKHYEIPLEGANAVVINRSMVVGKPLAMMLLTENATVTICHSRTKNLNEITKNADIVVTALGRAKFFSEDYFNENSVVIDVGMSLDDDEKISGDVDFENVSEKVKAITPALGGVGSVTTSLLLSHVIKGAKLSIKE
ncbi:MAG TPA: tetrahydrofolate dehydrogenase/cyclohydrolase catalytic domain-containing protein [Tissierellales bacterium]|nr:tetrahydrofolate dehydrogenase/cyclohydrolase catalytic domain-containing protein [Tissierellales bacterium]